MKSCVTSLNRIIVESWKTNLCGIDQRLASQRAGRTRHTRSDKPHNSRPSVNFAVAAPAAVHHSVNYYIANYSLLGILVGALAIVVLLAVKLFVDIQMEKDALRRQRREEHQRAAGRHHSK